MAFVEEQLDAMGCPMKVSMQIAISFEELFVNVARYAYEDAEEKGKVRIIIDPCEDEVGITLVDAGKPFDPLAKEDPDVTLSAEERKIGGLGIFMVKKSMDDVYYENTDGKNVFYMRKKFR